MGNNKKFSGRLQRRRFDMTPMIDIVFQLLIFFVLTFRVILPEGDFNIKMPPVSSDVVKTDSPQEPIRVSLIAEENGELKAIIINNVSANQNFKELRAKVLMAVSMAGGPDADNVEVELTPDDNLNYTYLIKAMTHITGESRNGRITKICDKIKFMRKKDNRKTINDPK
ncbi:MAG: biopolymer transporter ExbD [Planctomycetaceae bacterium]|nr:biopolymer transporter ExbD [Planctomycetaceae bacterium]